ncbi:ribonuclease HII [Temperatibacter marinus]|uniref:Ribonuclease HII n=1 Tax=Temperatibacter marinus TaxID=1456591 RepID=A0AA52H8C0_9PROT|nr:ribonuclease HII [Temperatibacter marinus]WND01971.1 ribonuclease HII [Temperatibacter marinus]
MTDLFTAAEIPLNSGPDWSAELAMQKRAGTGFVIGVDEVGRGPLSGPVVAAAVILDPQSIPSGLNDSKKLTAKKRDYLYDLLLDSVVDYSVAEVSVEVIDEINILQASMLAMRKAVDPLSEKAIGVLVDGNKNPGFNPALPTETLVKGDGRSLSIAAASILAKVYRDRLMQDLAKDYPGYGWETNAGYGSQKHRDALRTLGVTPHHRKSFSPVSELLASSPQTSP